MLRIDPKEHYHAVIMAGGGGTRLWPLSRQSRPKQMINLVGKKTLFQETIFRLDRLFPPRKILVVTTKGQAGELQREADLLDPTNFILEPEPKGTASVVGIAAMAAFEIDHDAILAILPADHYIKNIPAFRSLLESAFEAAEKGYLVTLSIEPKYPATGYGYIHRGETVLNALGNEVFRVKEFKEKPDRVTAEEYIESGEYGWNSGMFIWRADAILEEIKKYLPDLYSTLEKCGANWTRGGSLEIDPIAWHEIEPQTIDYGIMEKSDRCVTIQAKELGWSDIGDWNSLSEVLPLDRDGNIIHAEEIMINNSKDLIIHSNNPDKLIAVQGVSDLIIVETEDALLICKKEDSQKVKDIVANLKKNGKTNFL